MAEKKQTKKNNTNIISQKNKLDTKNSGIVSGYVGNLDQIRIAGEIIPECTKTISSLSTDIKETSTKAMELSIESSKASDDLRRIMIEGREKRLEGNLSIEEQKELFEEEKWILNDQNRADERKQVSVEKTQKNSSETILNIINIAINAALAFGGGCLVVYGINSLRQNK